MKKERDTYYDFLKGLAIMGVVAIHTMILKYEPYTIGGVILAIYRNLLDCCVPFFVSISGYFLASKKLNTKNEYIGFIRNRLKTIYIPMLVWALPWLVLSLLSSQTFLEVVAVTFKYFIGGLSIFYFIALILELYIQLPVIQRIKRGGVIILFIISLIVTLGWSIIKYRYGIKVPLVVYASFPTHICFFALGCYIGKNKIHPNLCLSLFIMTSGLILAILESYYWLEFNSKNNWLGLKASVQFLSFGVILLLFTKKLSSNYRSNKITRIIEKFGTQSMPIYMSHMLVLFALNIIGYTSHFWIIKWGAVFLLDVIFIFSLKKILSKNFLSYIGIR